MARIDDAGLAQFLESGQLQGEADRLYGFSILFGFDEHGQDFVVVRSGMEGGLHFVMTIDNGSVQ